MLARKSGKIVDESTFHPSVIEGVERQARRHGMSTSFVSVDFSDLDAARPQVESIAGDPSAAIVLLGTELGEEDFRLFRDCAAHIIVLDSWSDQYDFDAVVMSNEDSTLRAVNYLIEHGHRKIGYLAGDFRIQNFKARERGFERALSEAGIEVEPAWRVSLGTTLETAYEDMAAWLASTPRERLPTAFFADNDVLAVGAFSNPPLTTVHVLKHEVGEIAVRRLVGNIRSPKVYTCRTMVSTYFVERRSVKSTNGTPRPIRA